MVQHQNPKDRLWHPQIIVARASSQTAQRDVFTAEDSEQQDTNDNTIQSDVETSKQDTIQLKRFQISGSTIESP